MDLAGLAGCTSNEQPPADGAEALSPAPPAFVITNTELVSPNGKRYVRVTDARARRLESSCLAFIQSSSTEY